MKTKITEKKARVTAVRDIKDERVIKLLVGEGLSPEAAKALGIKEIEFVDKNGVPYLGYGLTNISGGHSLITLQKGTNNVGPGDVAVIKSDGDNSSCLLFAGVRDAIAYATMYGLPSLDSIVMFSTSLAKKAFNYIENRYNKVYYFAPNSNGRVYSLKVLLLTDLDVVDMSAGYKDYKDLRKYCTAIHGGSNKGDIRIG